MTTALNLYGQVVIGTVVSKNEGKPIPDVYVSAFINSMALSGETTDASGQFLLKLSIGRYEIIANHVGYELATKYVNLKNLNDTLIVDFTLEDGKKLEVIEISYISPNRNTANVTKLSRKDFNILPGSFDDPTRLLLKFPSISTSNDQANSVIYRGMPSHYMKWELNGQEIVNPNHTSNAGTLSDLFSSASGGVNMLDGQSLTGASFYGSPNATVFNAISGVNDLETSSIDKYLQLSLLGLGAGYSFKGLSIGYRYSFTGLLGDMGVDFGGEKIHFQDINLRYVPKLRTGKLTIATVYGNSENIYTKSDSATTLKEFQDIAYKSKALLTSVNYQIGKSTFGSNYSRRNDSRKAAGVIPIEGSLLTINDISDVNEQKAGFTFTNKVNSVMDWGLKYELVAYDNSLDYRMNTFELIEQINLVNANLSYCLTATNYKFKAMINPVYRIEYNDFSPDFHLEFSKPLTSTQNISLALGHSSQTQPGFVHLFSDPKLNLNATKSLQFNLVFASAPSASVNFELQSFYHLVYNVPQTDQGYSAFNNLDLPPADAFTLNDQAKVIGVSGQGEFKLPKSLWLNVNASLFQSNYRTLAVWVPSVHSFAHTFNLSLGKVWSFKSNTQFLRAGTSFHHRGGSKVFPLLIENDFTTYDYSQGPISTLAAYYRFDARVSYQKKKSTWSLDLQNVTNRLNEGYYFKDQPSGNPTLQQQLGLIPVLSYRVLF